MVLNAFTSIHLYYLVCFFPPNISLHNKIHFAKGKFIYNRGCVMAAASLGELLSIGRFELVPSVVSKASRCQCGGNYLKVVQIIKC